MQARVPCPRIQMSCLTALPTISTGTHVWVMLFLLVISIGKMTPDSRASPAVGYREMAPLTYYRALIFEQHCSQKAHHGARVTETKRGLPPHVLNKETAATDHKAHRK